MKHYELAVIRPPANGAAETVHHFYFEPFSRSDLFVRLNSSRPNTSLEVYLPRNPNYTNLVLTRQRDLWGDQGANSDQLLIDGLNVLQANTSPRSGVNLAVFAYDAGPDGATDLSKGELLPFNQLTFLTAVDVSIPASPDASGTVAVTDVARGPGIAACRVNRSVWCLARVAHACYVDACSDGRSAMPTTTIRLDDELKARVAAAAARAGKTSHAFILDAIAQTVGQAELQNQFHSEADERWVKILDQGKTVPWDEMRTYLSARAAGQPSLRRPRARALTR